MSDFRVLTLLPDKDKLQDAKKESAFVPLSRKIALNLDLAVEISEWHGDGAKHTRIYFYDAAGSQYYTVMETMDEIIKGAGK